MLKVGYKDEKAQPVACVFFQPLSRAADSKLAEKGFSVN
jgi:hypothetical protein